KMLAKLGYETRALDKTFTQVTLERPGWTSVVRASMSDDNAVVWLDAYLLYVSYPEDVPAGTWKRLVAANEQTAPAAFSFNAKNKRLYLSHPVPNEGVTAVVLRKELEV